MADTLVLAVFIVTMSVLAFSLLRGKLSDTLVPAVFTAHMSVIAFLRVPVSYESSMQNGIIFSVFIIANSMALLISIAGVMVSLAVGTVEPASWRRMLKSMMVGLIITVAAFHQIVLEEIGDQPMMRLMVTHVGINGIESWVFVIANSMALLISVAVIVVNLGFGTVEPASWRRIRKAMMVALFCIVVAFHQIVLIVIGDQPMLRLVVTSLFVATMASTLTVVLTVLYTYQSPEVKQSTVPSVDR